MESFKTATPLALGFGGTGATFFLQEYGLTWIGALCGILTIIHLSISIFKNLNKK